MIGKKRNLKRFNNEEGSELGCDEGGIEDRLDIDIGCSLSDDVQGNGIQSMFQCNEDVWWVLQSLCVPWQTL